MPNRFIRALWAPIVVALVAALSPAAAQGAKDVVAELRVVGDGGVLESGKSYVTDTERVRTDPGARCFVEGEGGSGDRVRLEGPTAMGLVETAGDSRRRVDPLSVTDEFGFGLGLCGIGKVAADESNYWALTVNHQAAQVGGDQLPLQNGDDVLWDLTTFPPDPELELIASPGTTPGTLEVTVLRWVCSTDFPPPEPVCTSEPAQGATVSGGDAGALTDGSGKADVPLGSAGKYKLQATLAAHLDSNIVRVCVDADAAACPDPADPHGRRIIGRRQADNFVGTDGWDSITSRGGDDRISLLDGGADRVRCGGGRDRVLIAEGDEDDSIAANCERVRTVLE